MHKFNLCIYVSESIMIIQCLFRAMAIPIKDIIMMQCQIGTHSVWTYDIIMMQCQVCGHMTSL